ncbi:MAG: LPS assembly lipoprotein LptE [Gammaproteobacteria bacterium]|nr:LPS assembly lipoprotein LptE [Gammaproteobacteria bacterium]
MNYKKVTSDEERVTKNIFKVFSLSLVPRSSSLPSCRSILVLALSLAMTGCGFHLRGQVELPESLQAIYIKGGMPDSPMRNILRQKLISSGVEVVQQQQAATATLVIIKDETTRREVSLNAAGQPNEYELKYQLSYQLLDQASNTLIPAQSLSQLRTYQYDPNQVLAKEEEERQLKTKMALSAVNQMLRQISTRLRKREQAQSKPDRLAPDKPTQ